MYQLAVTMLSAYQFQCLLRRCRTPPGARVLLGGFVRRRGAVGRCSRYTSLRFERLNSAC